MHGPRRQMKHEHESTKRRRQISTNKYENKSNKTGRAPRNVRTTSSDPKRIRNVLPWNDRNVWWQNATNNARPTWQRVSSKNKREPVPNKNVLRLNNGNARPDATCGTNFRNSNRANQPQNVTPEYEWLHTAATKTTRTRVQHNHRKNLTNERDATRKWALRKV